MKQHTIWTITLSQIPNTHTRFVYLEKENAYKALNRHIEEAFKWKAELGGKVQVERDQVVWRYDSGRITLHWSAVLHETTSDDHCV